MITAAVHVQARRHFADTLELLLSNAVGGLYAINKIRIVRGSASAWVEYHVPTTPKIHRWFVSAELPEWLMNNNVQAIELIEAIVSDMYGIGLVRDTVRLVNCSNEQGAS